MNIQHYDAIIIGAGPAGLSAGIYLSRAKLKTLILNQGVVGGQTILTHEIANYPGVEPISGYQLAYIMKNQALSFGCDIVANTTITSLDLLGSTKKITTSDGDSYHAKAVIIATGGKPRELGVAGESEFKGRGISYCATCDGDFFTNKEVVVVGGGNSALEEAVSLTKYASKVTIVHALDHFQGFEHAIKEAENHNKITIMLQSSIKAFNGEESIKSVTIYDAKNDKEFEYPTDGAFIFIGYVPNNDFLPNGIIQRNERNEIITDNRMRTDIAGVFAAGDGIEKPYRQITTAVADGTIAALSAADYIHRAQ